MPTQITWLPRADPGPIRWTGLALMLVAALRLALQLTSVAFITALFGAGALTSGRPAIFAVLATIVLIASIIPMALFATTLWGGWNAFRLRNWTWALVGFVLACVPLFGCLLIELPIGLLGLAFTLNGEELFEASRAERG